MKRLLLFCFFLPLLCFAQKQPPAVCYEIFVRSFADSDDDGIGDLKGITARLDYFKDLNIDAIWLTPVCLSQSYHKYDVEDYYRIDPQYGTLEDYKQLISEAHKRGIKVLKDLVINHSSSRHPWFQEAQKGRDNPYRNYYLWLSPKAIDSMGLAAREKTADSWETTPWHFARPGDDEKYYGLFSGMMPDLNYDNPRVRQEIYNVGKYWLQLGVDGFRLDAAKHIYPDWEASKSHAFWQEFRSEMEKVNPDVYLVGEVWTTADKVAPFLRGLKATFNFDLHFALIRALQSGKAGNMIKTLKASYEEYGRVAPDFIDATFLTNHDQNRIASELKGDINKLKAAANLLLTLPGEPYLYYGEELGMLGVKPDERIREPFLWAPKEKDSLRTYWGQVPLLNTDATVTPLDVQQTDARSLYHHYKRLIAFRKSQPALRQVLRPNLAPYPSGPQVVAFVRPYATGDLLVVQNISGKVQPVTLVQGFKKVIFETKRAVKPVRGRLQVPPFGLMVLGK